MDLDTAERRFSIVDCAISSPGEDQPWFTLGIRLHGKRFDIRVSPSNFRKSPCRTQELYNHLGFLMADDQDSVEYYDDQDQSRDRSMDGIGYRFQGVTVYDCFAWAVDPCFDALERLAPPPPRSLKLTLNHFYATESFKCDLLAVGDRLFPGSVEPRQNRLEDPIHQTEHLDSALPWTTTSFPFFRPEDVQVIHNFDSGPHEIFDSDPERVRVGRKDLFFKALDPDNSHLDLIVRREIAVYEKIAANPNLAGLRISRLYGLVCNERNQLMGLLLHLIDTETPLSCAVGPDTPQTAKDRWSRQIRTTVAAFHEAGIVWGDAHPGNILIDDHLDAWIVDFGGGWTEGWVDRDKAETREGDLQGIERILEFIQTGVGVEL
ncbi:hypothetical protein B0H66DRAFT_466373 [Apodospora peruviana]|uniref:Protein kinase domain-containing protein n=1 Tax=Apodospora peruviana TaxID=516989 RepID=A0AAE0IQC4_9PEZI|nr:hypothetical protein B0H66DRAFT_466373 [Apodospora peruviana]